MEAYRDRLQGEELVWLRQFRRLLKPYLRLGATMIDVGCATGYAYESFRRYGITYTGIDFNPARIAVAQDWFGADRNARFFVRDIKEPLPWTADIVICDATLEHIPLGLQPALRNIADAADKVLLLRAFLGDEEILEWADEMAMPPRVGGSPINQFAFRDVLGYLESKGFATKVYRCDYSDSMPMWKHGFVRTYYVVMAVRRQNDDQSSQNCAGSDVLIENS